jgi:hypothetical protein
MDYRPPGIDFAFYDVASAQSWTVHATGGQPVSPLEHNSALLRLAMTMDVISQPNRPQFVTHGVDFLGASPYAGVAYNGPYAAANATTVPVVGAFAQPAGGDAQVWWRALARFAERLQTFTRTNGTVPSPAAFGRFVGAAGTVVPPGIVPMRTAAMPQFWIKEDIGTAAVAAQVFAGASAYAARRVLGAATGDGGTSTAATADENAVRPVIDKLAAEYVEQGKRGAMRAGVSFLASLAGAYAVTKLGKGRKGKRRSARY